MSVGQLVGRTAPGGSRTPAGDIDSRYAWVRLTIAVLLGTLGGVGMWSVVVVLPSVQAEFGISRADAAIGYTLTMIGFGCGNIVLGRLVDRFGIFQPLLGGFFILFENFIHPNPFVF